MRILVTDYSNYCPYGCRDGGAYSFTTEYTLTPQRSYAEVRYYTSATLPFCSIRGLFESCQECSSWTEGRCEAESRGVPISLPLDTVEKTWGNPDFEIVIEVDDHREILWSGRGHRRGYCMDCHHEYK